MRKRLPYRNLTLIVGIVVAIIALMSLWLKPVTVKAAGEENQGRLEMVKEYQAKLFPVRIISVFLERF